MADFKRANQSINQSINEPTPRKKRPELKVYVLDINIDSLPVVPVPVAVPVPAVAVAVAAGGVDTLTKARGGVCTHGRPVRGSITGSMLIGRCGGCC